MRYYRIPIKPRGPTLTPWHSDTLFGVLCWQVRHEQGEEALSRWLSPWRDGNPRFVLSNAFPGDLLPKPLIASVLPTSQAESVEDYDRRKRLKRAALAAPEDFAALIRGQLPDLQAVPAGLESRVVLHNQVNRVTGTTTGLQEEGERRQGNLYEVDEFYLPADIDHLTLYLGAADDAAAAEAHGLLTRVSRSGYGKKKSSGFGAFEVGGLDSWTPPEARGTVNGFVTLSNMTPARTDPAIGFWRHRVKFGKLGESMARAENPFKSPFIHFEPGACFHTGGPPRPWYGRLIGGLSPALPEAVQNLLALALPMAAPESVWRRDLHAPAEVAS